MSRSSLFTVCLLAGAALLCAGCELPRGPLRWDPVHLDRLNILPHGELHVPGPFCVTEDCHDHCPRECANEPQGYPGHSHSGGDSPDHGDPSPRGPRLTQHHHAVPLAGPGVDAPWPKFHPVPTRPVFESRCLPPPEAAVPPQQLQPLPQLQPSQTPLLPQPQYLPQE
jgi:hypothetical protein